MQGHGPLCAPPPAPSSRPRQLDREPSTLSLSASHGQLLFYPWGQLRTPRAHIPGGTSTSAWHGWGGWAAPGPQGSDTCIPTSATSGSALRTTSRALTEHPLPSPLSTALFLDRLMKRRQDSGYLIEEIGDVLLARVRAPSPCPPGVPSFQPGTWHPGPGRPGLRPLPDQDPGGSHPVLLSRLLFPREALFFPIPPETPSLA